MTVKVSIVLPTYNQAHYLPATLDSIFAQSYSNFELIVVNDGSTDGTSAVLDRYQKLHDFIRVDQDNQKLPKALNAGFMEASGAYLTWTSSDNILKPTMLGVLTEALDSDSNVSLVYADFYVIDEDGRDLGRFNVPDYDRHLLLQANLVHCCFLYRRECMTQVGLFDPEFIYGEDWEYWIRISKFYLMKRIPQALYRYRLHRSSMTGELLRGTAHNMGHTAFTRRIRERMPISWWIGKLKWHWLRFSNPKHPVVMGRSHWMHIVAKAAGDPLKE